MPTALGSLVMVPLAPPHLSGAPLLPGAGGCELVPSAPLEQTAATTSPLEQNCAVPDP